MSQQASQTGGTAATAPARYEIDPIHTTVDFKVRHMMIAYVRGEFSGVTGTVIYDARNPANSKVEASIEAATIHTRDPQRDQHLKSADFLDVEKYAKLTFVSKKVAAGKGRGTITGDLTIHGVTREVTLDVEGPTPEAKDPWGNIRAGAAATARINRKDFGLEWNTVLETGGLLVGDEVTINIEVEMLRK